MENEKWRMENGTTEGTEPKGRGAEGEGSETILNQVQHRVLDDKVVCFV